MGKRDLHKQYKNFCYALRKFREERGFNQIDIAKKIKKPQSYISKIESGERRLDFVELVQLCDAMDISMVDFVQFFEKLSD